MLKDYIVLYRLQTLYQLDNLLKVGMVVAHKILELFMYAPFNKILSRSWGIVYWA